MKWHSIILGVLLSSVSLAQTIEWETTLDSGMSGEVIVDIEVLKNKDILAVGHFYPGSYPEPAILKFDSLGSLKWFKSTAFDTLPNAIYGFINSIPDGEDNFYVGGYATNPLFSNNDFLAMIDTAGDTLWFNRYTYASFYSTMNKALVLKDKSIITVGEIQTAFGFDIISRRVDSLGNTMWENIYNQTGEQFGYDLVEMMDGSIIIGGSSDGDNLIMRIGFDGEIIELTQYMNTSDVRGVNLNLIRDNAVLQTGFGNAPILSFMNFNLYRDSGYFSLQSIPFSTTSSIIFQDSNVLFANFFDDTVRLIHANLYNRNFNWEISFGDINSDYKSIQGLDYLSPNQSIVFGLYDSANSQDYWLAKISGVGEEWVPDRCAYQPPIAGFDFEYNYPVLTLRDTSSGGLKYLDTIYTWQWNTNVGTNGTNDSLVVFFDTAVSKTIDIELVIGNWYGCTDSTNITLNFDPSGITMEKALELKVYPNPVSDYLNIEFAEIPTQNILFELFDIQGNKVMFETFIGKSLRSRVHGLPSGMYFYRITSGTQVKRGKIVKQ